MFSSSIRAIVQGHNDDPENSLSCFQSELLVVYKDEEEEEKATLFLI